MANLWQRHQFVIVCASFQIAFVVLFAIFAEYSPRAKPISQDNNASDVAADSYTIDRHYSMFQDVHVMIFLGFGYLMTFLKRYGYSALGINFLLASFSIQWGILMRGVVEMIAHHHNVIPVGMLQMLLGDFTAAAVLITMGVMLGKLSPTQYLIMAFCEIIFGIVSEHVAINVLQTSDVGGSMIVHVFGAYFGLAMAKVMHRRPLIDHRKQESVYHSDLFSMIGTLFLWVFWPSFNSAVAETEDGRMRAALNTFLSMCACTVVTLMVTALLNKGKIVMEYAQNAALAGGVAIGSSANFMLQPVGAVVIGSVAAVLSALGIRFVTPFLAKKLRIHDTCGVNNLHGMPGILAGLVAVLVTALCANEEKYGQGLYTIYVAMDPTGKARSAGHQALFQLAALGVSIGSGIIGGVITGIIVQLPIWNKVEDESFFDDVDYWELPEHFDPFEEKEEISYHHVIGVAQLQNEIEMGKGVQKMH